MMKWKNKLAIASLPFFTIVVSLLVGFNNKDITRVKAEDYNKEGYIVSQTDLRQFNQIDKPNGTCSSYRIEDDAVVMDGDGWDSGFASTTQFDTLASSYYFKAHVESEQTSFADLSVGFNIFFDDANKLSFYIKWRDDDPKFPLTTISESVILGRVDGDARGYQYIQLPTNGSDDYNWTTPPYDFIECWGDYGAWLTGNNRFEGYQPFMWIDSNILLTKGFDMTLYVDREEVKGRLADIYQMEIDELDDEGNVKQRFYTPRYAIDAYTCPKGEDSPLAHIKPSIGFWTRSLSPKDIYYSDIEFGAKKNYDPIKASFKQVGGNDTTSIETDISGVKYDNECEHSGFYLAEDLSYESERMDFKADVKGNIENVSGASTGFTFYYDEDNYIILSLNWTDTTETIDSFDIFVCAEGNMAFTYKGNTNPYFDLASTSGNKIVYSDFGGFVSDAEYAYDSGGSINFNKFRDEASVYLKTGFTLGVSRSRTVYREKVVDNYQLSMTGIDKTDTTKFRTWYTPIWSMDAFTYPNGDSEPSPLIDVLPSIGLYTYQTEEIKYSNFKFNNCPLIIKDEKDNAFGSRNEKEWTFAGSYYGYNWNLKDNQLVGLWELLDVDSHINEVNALYQNDMKDFYMSAILSFDNVYSDTSSIGMYPYYLDGDNYLLAKIVLNEDTLSLLVDGKLLGNNIDDKEILLEEELKYASKDSLLFEIGIEDNQIDFFIDKAPSPTYSLTIEDDSFISRTLASSYMGFNIFNVDSSLNDIVLKSNERINPYIPIDGIDNPIIEESGERTIQGNTNEDITLPSYKAINFLNKEIDVTVEIYKKDGTLVKTMEKGEDKISFANDGKYIIKAYAVDEWGLQSGEITFEITIIAQANPDVGNKAVAWQTIVVLSIFGVILLATIGTAILLLIKMKKEKERAAALNRKNQEKNKNDDF